MIPVTNLRPFTRMLMTIGQIPTSYLISMTYEEQLLWLCNYLEKTVIPAIDNNAEAVKELQDLFIELKSYVDNYFENLDVQEEINNKLDEMATDGTLDEIINQEIFSELNARIDALDSTCKYHFIKTGTNTGDCIGIETTTEFILYDLSASTDYQNITNYLSSHNISKIDKIIISHFHNDHIGGYDANGYIGLINSSYVGDDTEVYLPTTPDFNEFINDTATPESDVVGRVTHMMNAVVNATITRGLTINYMETNDLLTIDGIVLRFLNCSETDYANYYDVTQTFDGTHYCTLYNNFSMCVEVANKSNTLLLTGDIEYTAEEHIESFIHREITLKKLSHHGSVRPASTKYLIKTNAKINVYMNGLSDTDNTSRNPEIALPIALGNSVYSTDYNNSMEFIDDGFNLQSTSNLSQKIYPNASSIGLEYLGNNGLKNLNIPKYGNEINLSDDLNDYKTCGDFISSTGTISASLSNIPRANMPAFKLCVEYLHSTERLVQTITESNASIRQFRRFYNGSWSEWQEIKNVSHAITYASATNLATNDYTKIPYTTLANYSTIDYSIDNTTNTITIKNSGIYEVSGYINVSNIDADDLIQCAIFVNGTRLNRYDYIANGNNLCVVIAPSIVNASSANTTIDIRIYNTVKKSLTVSSANQLIIKSI